MEEKQAAEYYDELVRKGGNAAKYKQGLGFGTQSSNREPSGSLGNFVKESSQGRAAIEKESRIESIRDKLKKREADSTHEQSSSRPLSADDDGKKKSSRKSETEELGSRKRVRDNYDSDEGRGGKARRHRRLSPSDERAASRKRSEESRRPSRSPSRRRSTDNGIASARESSRKYHGRLGRRSNSSSSSQSFELTKRGGRSVRDRSVSAGDEIRSRHSRSSGRKENCSPTRSYERRTRKRSRSRSRSRGRDSDQRDSYRRAWAHSPYYESCRRTRSRSPRSYRRSSGLRDSRHVEGARKRYADDGKDAPSSGKYRHEERGARSKEENAPDRNYSKLIPNFDSMTAAEKVKAKMKLQLSETVMKDRAKGMSDEWERFDFNQDVPLDDDAKLDHFGDGTGAGDDTGFLKHTGSTFPSSFTQGKREAMVRDAHEAAIFGPPEGLIVHSLEAEDEIVSTKNDVNIGIANEKLPVSSVVSEQVIAMQKGATWQERARKMREAREGALAT